MHVNTLCFVYMAIVLNTLVSAPGVVDVSMLISLIVLLGRMQSACISDLCGQLVIQFYAIYLVCCSNNEVTCLQSSMLWIWQAPNPRLLIGGDQVWLSSVVLF